jgi:hypothetical protein
MVVLLPMRDYCVGCAKVDAVVHETPSVTQQDEGASILREKALMLIGYFLYIGWFPAMGRTLPLNSKTDGYACLSKALSLTSIRKVY